MGSGSPSLCLTGSPFSIGFGGGGSADTAGVEGGLRALFFSGGSPRFRVDNLLFSDMTTIQISQNQISTEKSAEELNVDLSALFISGRLPMCIAPQMRRPILIT